MASIAVDIDSTLYDFETAAREAMFKLYKETGDDAYKVGAYHPWTEWRSPADALGLDRWLKAIDVCHEANVVESQTPFAGAVETCQALIEQGHTLLYISNRAEGSAIATKRWLDLWDFTTTTGETKVLCTSEDKAPYMRNCQYLIDDRLKTVVQFVYDHLWWSDQVSTWQEHGEDQSLEDCLKRGERKAFVKGYQYNQAATDIPNVYVALTWAGLNEYLVRKGVLTEEAYRALEAVA